MQLVACGGMNKYFNINYTIGIDISDIESNTYFTLTRQCDAVIFDVLVLPLNVDFDKIEYFELEIGGTTIMRVSFSLLIHLSLVERKKDGYYITINENLFKINYLSKNDIENHLMGIPLVALQYHEARVHLRSQDKFQYKLINRNIFYDTQQRGYIAQNGHEMIINNFDTTIESNTNICNLNSGLVSTGLFIETFDELIGFTIILNGHIRFDMNEFMINSYGQLLNIQNKWTNEHTKTFIEYGKNMMPVDIVKLILDECKKLNPKKYLYWIPFEPYKKWDDNSKINSCLNLSQIEKTQIRMNFKNNKYNFDTKIHTFQKNILRVMSGMGGNAFVK